jgi:hypothetical protein
MDLKRITEIGYALREKSITGGRNFHASFILNKSKLLSIGVNRYNKSHPKNQEFGYSPMAGIHSEMAACLKLGLTDCSSLGIVNVRINRNGQLSNSCFCKGCSNLVKYLNFKEAFFTNDGGKFERFC